MLGADAGSCTSASIERPEAALFSTGWPAGHPARYRRSSSAGDGRCRMPCSTARRCGSRTRRSGGPVPRRPRWAPPPPGHRLPAVARGGPGPRARWCSASTTPARSPGRARVPAGGRGPVCAGAGPCPAAGRRAAPRGRVAERERDRMEFLARIGRLMEAPLSVEQRLQQPGRSGGPGARRLVRGAPRARGRGGADRRRARRPGQGRFVLGCRSATRPTATAPGGAIQVSRSDGRRSSPRSPTSCSSPPREDAEHCELIRSLGMRSAMVVPLIVHGRSLGALTLVHAESGQWFDELDLAFATSRRHRGRRPGQRPALRAAAADRADAAGRAAPGQRCRTSRAARWPPATGRRPTTGTGCTSAATSMTSSRAPRPGSGPRWWPTCAARAPRPRRSRR